MIATILAKLKNSLVLMLTLADETSYWGHTSILDRPYVQRSRQDTKGETMRIISIETKTVAGREYNVIKGYSEKSISKRQYQSDVEGYGSELVHFVKKGELYDIIIAL